MLLKNKMLRESICRVKEVVRVTEEIVLCNVERDNFSVQLMKVKKMVTVLKAIHIGKVMLSEERGNGRIDGRNGTSLEWNIIMLHLQLTYLVRMATLVKETCMWKGMVMVMVCVE